MKQQVDRRTSYTMVDQLSVAKMICHEQNIPKRPSTGMLNEDIDEDMISCEQKMLPDKLDDLKGISTVQKVDNGRNMYGYRFVKVSKSMGLY